MFFVANYNMWHNHFFKLVTHVKGLFSTELENLSFFYVFAVCGWWVDWSIQAGQRLGFAGPHQLFHPVLRVQRCDFYLFFIFLSLWRFYPIITSCISNLASLLHHLFSHLTGARNENVSHAVVIAGTVRIEMFRNMQNAEIIRKMTEEFDEVPVFSSSSSFFSPRKTVWHIIV